MAHCKECGTETSPGQRLCYPCLNSWVEMRRTIYDYLTKKYGKLSRENHPIFKKETKRLEKIWRKDKTAFMKEMDGE